MIDHNIVFTTYAASAESDTLDPLIRGDADFIAGLYVRLELRAKFISSHTAAENAKWDQGGKGLLGTKFVHPVTLPASII